MKIFLKVTAILLITMLAFAACGSKNSKNIDVMPYIEVEFKGLNTQGKAFDKLDYEKIENVLMKAAGYKDGEDTFPYLDVLFIVNTVDITPNTGLSNGDKVALKINSIPEVLEKYKITLASTEKTFTVSGLQEAQSIDLFSDVELVLEGASPFLQISVKNRSQDEFLKTVKYTNANNRNVAIGDIVTVTATYSQSAAEKLGYLIETTEKAFTIGEADEYVQKLKDIDDAVFQNLLKEATDKMESELSKDAAFTTKANPRTRAGQIFSSASGNEVFDSYSKFNKIDSPFPVAAYLLSEKNGEILDYKLKGATFFVIFAIHGTNEKNDSEAIIYSVVAIPNIIKTVDGIITASYADTWICSHYGLDEDVVYSKNIEQYKSSFNIDRISISY